MKEELTIRVAKPEDAKGLLEIYAPYVEKTAITFEYEVPSEEEFAGRIRHILTKYPYLVLEENGELLGYVYAGTFNERSAYDWAVETTIYIREDQKKRELGRKMYAALEQVLKKQNITKSFGMSTEKDCSSKNRKRQITVRQSFFPQEQSRDRPAL